MYIYTYIYVYIYTHIYIFIYIWFGVLGFGGTSTHEADVA